MNGDPFCFCSKPKGTSFKDASEAEYKAVGAGDETRIQIVLPGGKKVAMKVKLAATILDIYQHVMTYVHNGF